MQELVYELKTELIDRLELSGWDVIDQFSAELSNMPIPLM